jgi:hypothetical protein
MALIAPCDIDATVDMQGIVYRFRIQVVTRVTKSAFVKNRERKQRIDVMRDKP